LIFIVGLNLTAPAYVDCKEVLPDESLDIAMEPNDPISPVLALSLNIRPCLLPSWKIFHLQGTCVQASTLRC
jgi:hypothetical protein